MSFHRLNRLVELCSLPNDLAQGSARVMCSTRLGFETEAISTALGAKQFPLVFLYSRLPNGYVAKKGI